jgi:hypothetical protein
MITANEATKIISTPQAWAGFADVRDIVDLGQLRAAQRVSFSIRGTIIEGIIEYLADYSAAVHNGATIKYSNGNTRRIQGRPFIDEAVKKQPPLENMGKLLK